MINRDDDILKLIHNNSHKDFVNFHNLSPDTFFNFFIKKSAQQIEEQGRLMALNLFHKASVRIPAYIDFLKEHKIDAKSVKTKDDFISLPVTTKKNYLKKYNLKEINWDGLFRDLHLISVSSGSTGEPFFWPRGFGLEYETALEYEIILKYFFEADKKRTLFIIGYAMGMYVAGVFTLNSLMSLSAKGYPLTVVTPGADKDSILRIIKNLGGYFDQTILAAYPAVLKDIIDKGVQENIGWEQYNLKFISGGEGFSEEFRKYIYKRAGVKNYLRSLLNTYGSADAAILGHETPLTVLIRKFASENNKLRETLFGGRGLPSLLQYYPPFKYFEEVDGNLLFSTYGGVPLIRYGIGDTGGIISYTKIIETLNNFGIDVEKEMAKYECEKIITKLPFVYLFGRSDNTKILYGANIYPEHIKSCLEQKEIIHSVTGKYFTDTVFDKDHNQTFYIAVELMHGVNINKQLNEKIAEVIYQHLLNINNEYKYLSQTIGKNIYPSVEIFTYGNPKYFSPRIKPKYVKK